jgi:hypothetical protein
MNFRTFLYNLEVSLLGFILSFTLALSQIKDIKRCRVDSSVNHLESFKIQPIKRKILQKIEFLIFFI